MVPATGGLPDANQCHSSRLHEGQLRALGAIHAILLKVLHVLTKPEPEKTRRFPAASLKSFLADVFRACGLPEGDAATVAWGMLEADLTGSDAHGVFRLAGYVRQ